MQPGRERRRMSGELEGQPSGRYAPCNGNNRPFQMRTISPTSSPCDRIGCVAESQNTDQKQGPWMHENQVGNVRPIQSNEAPNQCGSYQPSEDERMLPPSQKRSSFFGYTQGLALQFDDPLQGVNDSRPQNDSRNSLPSPRTPGLQGMTYHECTRGGGPCPKGDPNVGIGE